MSTKRKIKCPRCGTQTEYSPDKTHRPFCSERCQLVDFGAWASEKYAIPHTPVDTDDLAKSKNKDSDNNVNNSSDERGRN